MDDCDIFNVLARGGIFFPWLSANLQKEISRVGMGQFVKERPGILSNIESRMHLLKKLCTGKSSHITTIEAQVPDKVFFRQ